MDIFYKGFSLGVQQMLQLAPGFGRWNRVLLVQSETSSIFCKGMAKCGGFWPRGCYHFGQVVQKPIRCAQEFGVSNPHTGAQTPGVSMEEKLNRLGMRERQIVDLLLQGCDNSEIALKLNMAERTVKAHFNRLFLRFGIRDGIKRVKLATLLYRRELWKERQASESMDQISASRSLSNLSQEDSRTETLQHRLVQLSMS
jgi:hypothetical protein